MALEQIGLGLATSALGSGLFGGGGNKDAGKPREFALSNPFFQATLDRRKGPDFMQAGASGALLDLQGGLFSDADFLRQFVTDNQGADLAGSLGMDFLSGISAYDPYEIAEMQYNILNPILQDQANEDFLNLENRLFAQGQLFDSGALAPGQGNLNAFFDSKRDAERKLLADSFGLGLQAQQNQYNIGSGLLQLDPSLRGLFQNLSSNALTGGLNIQDTSTRLFSALSGAQGMNPSGGGGTAGNYIGAGLLNSGVNQLTGGIKDLFPASRPNPSDFPVVWS